MKLIIAKKLYDTDSAEKIFEYKSGDGLFVVYKTKNSRYFLWGNVKGKETINTMTSDDVINSIQTYDGIDLIFKYFDIEDA